MGETVSVRVPEDLVRGLEALSSESGTARSDLLREILQRGMAAKRLELALAAYREGRVSAGRASEMADLPLVVFLEEARRAGVPRNYGKEEAREDVEWATGP